MAIVITIHSVLAKHSVERGLYQIYYKHPVLSDDYSSWTKPEYESRYYYYLDMTLFGKIFYFLLLIFLWMLDIYYTYKIKEIPYSAFNESRELGHAEFIIAVTTVIVLIVHCLSELPDSVIFYTSTMLGLMSLYICFEFIWPKLLRILRATSEKATETKNLTYCPRCGCKLRCMFI